MSNVSANMTTCPNEETLAAFIDGRLKQDARHELMEHIAGCAECRDVMTAARELESESVLESGNVRQFPARRSYIPAAIAAIAASIILVFAFVPEAGERVSLEISGGRAPVTSAYQPLTVRRVESRFSGFAYKTYKGPNRGTESEDDELWPMRLAADQLEKAASKSSWRKLRYLALARLLAGDRNGALSAIELAEHAGGGSNAGFLNDAAAVYVDRAHSGRAEDQSRAVKAAERAWASAKTPESAWNRALAYEVSGRTEDAVRAWEEYLAIDSASEWAKEANNHLHDLKDTFPQ